MCLTPGGLGVAKCVHVHACVLCVLCICVHVYTFFK